MRNLTLLGALRAPYAPIGKAPGRAPTTSCRGHPWRGRRTPIGICRRGRRWYHETNHRLNRSKDRRLSAERDR